MPTHQYQHQYSSTALSTNHLTQIAQRLLKRGDALLLVKVDRMIERRAPIKAAAVRFSTVRKQRAHAWCRTVLGREISGV